MAVFLTNTQFLQRYDWRWVAKNVYDDGAVGVTGAAGAATLAELQAGTTNGGAVLTQMIADAEALLMSAAAVSNRYTATQIAAYDPVLAARIVSDLTVGEVLKRRARAVADESVLNAAYTAALDQLEALRRGERIFPNVPDVPQAGLPATASMNPVAGVGPPLITTSAARYFGVLNPNLGGGQFGIN